MSILPNHTQGSTSSSCTALPLNPSSQNGKTIRPPSQSPSSLSRQIGSFHFSDSRPPIPLPRNNSGPLASATEDCGGSSQKVTGLETPNGKKTLPQEISDPHSRCHPGGRGVGFAQSTGKMSGALVSPQSQQRTGSSNSNGSTMHPSGKKVQLTNGNHLLNFYYDPISRPKHQPRAPLPRRQQKTKPYNKDLFLQANYKFVVLDSGNYAPEAMDPDKMLRWEDIICVRYSTPFLVQCPICLECPLCPQITSCGHIFCFPCILQYLLMGEEDHKGDSWKRCPLCFVMISPKDLYTIYIENVKQYCVGDTIEFMLLTRQKDSFTLSYKSKLETDFMPCLNNDTCDPFSKFTFTSDVDLSVRKAISDLDSWLVKADSGLVDDLEKLPYVCAAMEQLEQRKKYWNDHRTCESGRSCKSTDYQAASHVLASAPYDTCADYEACGLSHGTLSTDGNDHIKSCDDLITNKPNGGAWLDQTADESGLMEGQDTFLSSSYEDSQSLHRHSNETGDAKDKNSYNFFQAADGQHLILHPLNMRCLIHHYGSYDMLPHRISGRILQLETVTQSEAIRRRYRYLSHFSLTTTFELCEIDLSKILPPEAIDPFMDEIKKREKQRKQQAKKEQREKIKAEAAEAAAAAYSLPISTSFGQSSHDDSPTFSMDDFEALGSPPMTASSSPPTVGERRLFSSVTRLGFAAGHDSPSLKIQEPNSLPNSGVTTNPSGANGAQNAGTPSFADIMSKAKTVETLDAAKVNEVGKKGKKPSRVLLSTSRGRRY